MKLIYITFPNLDNLYLGDIFKIVTQPNNEGIKIQCFEKQILFKSAFGIYELIESIEVVDDEIFFVMSEKPTLVYPYNGNQNINLLPDFLVREDCLTPLKYRDSKRKIKI